ncbi:hypothetical protein PCK1_003018 [Pneumocystis canis]|nr:hypothetical protein PCK1_003018 [Pneumocystis canis]
MSISSKSLNHEFSRKNGTGNCNNLDKNSELSFLNTYIPNESLAVSSPFKHDFSISSFNTSGRENMYSQPSAPGFSTYCNEKSTDSNYMRADYTPELSLSAINKTHVLEIKRQQYELQRIEHRRRFEKEMKLLELRQKRDEQALLGYDDDTVGSISANSAPNTPPNLQISSDTRMYSNAVSKLTSPLQFYEQFHTTGQLATPPSDENSRSSHFSESRKESGESDLLKNLTINSHNKSDENASERHKNDENRNIFHDIFSNNNEQLYPYQASMFENDTRNKTEESSFVKKYLEMNTTDDNFPILIKRNNFSGMFPSSNSTLDLTHITHQDSHTEFIGNESQNIPKNNNSIYSPLGSNKNCSAFSLKNENIPSPKFHCVEEKEFSNHNIQKSANSGFTSFVSKNKHDSLTTNISDTFHYLKPKAEDYSDSKQFDNNSNSVSQSRYPMGVLPPNAKSPLGVPILPSTVVSPLPSSNIYGQYGVMNVPSSYQSAAYSTYSFYPINNQSSNETSQTFFAYGNNKGALNKKNTNSDANRFSGTSLETFAGKIYSLCKDQHGCRYLQKKLEERDPRQISMIFMETYPHAVELMTDPFGNYLCQKLLEHCNDDERTTIIQSVASNLVPISLNMHGTRAVQKMIEYLSTPEQIKIIINALNSNVVTLIKDLNGNHVIQKCLNRLSNDDIQFIFDAICSNCIEVATHRHGCCVLQRCIDHASDSQKIQIAKEITNHALNLVQDPFGNYVVQYILDLGDARFSEPLIHRFIGNVCLLSIQKFSSNVIEKCIRMAEPPTRGLLIEELPKKMGSLIRDSYANYVIQTSLDYADPIQRKQLVDCILPLLPSIRSTAVGRKISMRVEKNNNSNGNGVSSGTFNDSSQENSNYHHTNELLPTAKNMHTYFPTFHHYSEYHNKGYSLINKQVEIWDNDGDLWEDVYDIGEDILDVPIIQDNEENKTFKDKIMAKDIHEVMKKAEISGIPLPRNITPSVLMGGTIHRLGTCKTGVTVMDDWSDDLQLTSALLDGKIVPQKVAVEEGDVFEGINDWSEKPIKSHTAIQKRLREGLLPRRSAEPSFTAQNNASDDAFEDDFDIPLDINHLHIHYPPTKVSQISTKSQAPILESDNDDWGDSSLGIRSACGESRSARASITSSLSPTMSSITLSEDEGIFDGIELPSNTLDLQKRFDTFRQKKMSELISKEVDSLKDDFFSDIELDEDHFFDLSKNLNSNVNVISHLMTDNTLNLQRKPQATIKFASKSSRIPQPVFPFTKMNKNAPPKTQYPGTRPSLNQEKTISKKPSLMNFQNTEDDFHTMSTKRSMPSLQNQHSSPSQYTPSDNSRLKSNLYNAYYNHPKTVLENGHSKTQSNTSSTSNSRYSRGSDDFSWMINRIPHYASPTNASLARGATVVNKFQKGVLDKVSRDHSPTKIMTYPRKLTNYGDGTELDAFDDLPTFPAVENKYTVKTHKKEKVKHKDASDTQLASAFSRILEIVIGQMKYNPQTRNWEGNEMELQKFDLNITSPPRPALISHISDKKDIQIVGDMMFDPQKMCWIKVDPSKEDERDPFEGINDLVSNDPVVLFESGKTSKNSLSNSDYLDTQNFVGEEFDVGPGFVRKQREEEENWKKSMQGWIKQGLPNRNHLREIREIVING